MKPLYEISIEYQEFINSIDDCEEFTEQHLATLSAIQGDLKEKAINIGSYIKNIDAEYQAINMAIADMEKRQEKILKKANKLREYLKTNLEQCEIREVKSPYFDIKIKNNPLSVDIFDESLIPSEYKEEIVLNRIDKRRLSDALKNNFTIPGASLAQKTRLEIR